MKKNEQVKINNKCLEIVSAVGLDFASWHTGFVELSKKADIARTNDFVVLLSLGKLVSVYCISSGTLVDVLRFRVGYNRTSTRHIDKFCELMDVTFGIEETMCYRRLCKNYKEGEK